MTSLGVLIYLSSKNSTHAKLLQGTQSNSGLQSISGKWKGIISSAKQNVTKNLINYVLKVHFWNLQYQPIIKEIWTKPEKEIVENVSCESEIVIVRMENETEGCRSVWEAQIVEKLKSLYTMKENLNQN